MSTYIVKHPLHSMWPPRSSVVAIILATVLLAAAMVAIGMGFAPYIHVTVDNVRFAMPSGTTIAQLSASGQLRAKPGALLAVDGSVVQRAGGSAAVIVRNGLLVGPDQRLYDGDVVVGTDGTSTVEPIDVTRVPIQFGTDIEGSGPVMRLAQPGSVGVRELRVGRISGKTSAGKVILPASDMIIRRTSPRPTEKLVALTFDDGPWPGQTNRILDILKLEGVHATFFMLGGRVKNAPGLAKRVADEGHLIGNHTLSHSLLTKEKPTEVRRQIVSGAATIRSATGVQPVWFRPPYGAINGDVWKQTRELRLKVALWDVDTRDWSRPGTAKIVTTAEKNAKPGSIILMHDGGTDRRQTIAALPTIIRDLKARGYVFVTMEELDVAR